MHVFIECWVLRFIIVFYLVLYSCLCRWCYIKKKKKKKKEVFKLLGTLKSFNNDTFSKISTISLRWKMRNWESCNLLVRFHINNSLEAPCLSKKGTFHRLEIKKNSLLRQMKPLDPNQTIKIIVDVIRNNVIKFGIFFRIAKILYWYIKWKRKNNKFHEMQLWKDYPTTFTLDQNTNRGGILLYVRGRYFV